MSDQKNEEYELTDLERRMIVSHVNEIKLTNGNFHCILVEDKPVFIHIPSTPGLYRTVIPDKAMIKMYKKATAYFRAYASFINCFNYYVPAKERKKAKELLKKIKG